MSGGSAPIEDPTVSNELAQILGQKWQNYQSLFAPIENQQIAWATDPNTIKNAATQAGAQAVKGSAAAATGLQKAIETGGVKLTPDQQQAVQRRLGLEAGLSQVNAMNTAATNTYDSVTQVLGGGTTPTI